MSASFRTPTRFAASGGGVGLASWSHKIVLSVSVFLLDEIDSHEIHRDRRALSGLKTPDALQVAAALETECTAFVTNDRQIPPFAGLRVLQIRDYL